ncbi:MAG TPA: hypothetical protein VMX14_09685 [Anaerolineae bacterium]|nr:hypothetical protein [Anaerolineae bacterium]
MFGYESRIVCILHYLRHDARTRWVSIYLTSGWEYAHVISDWEVLE